MDAHADRYRFTQMTVVVNYKLNCHFSDTSILPLFKYNKFRLHKRNYM